MNKRIPVPIILICVLFVAGSAFTADESATTQQAESESTEGVAHTEDHQDASSETQNEASTDGSTATDSQATDSQNEATEDDQAAATNEVAEESMVQAPESSETPAESSEVESDDFDDIDISAEELAELGLSEEDLVEDGSQMASEHKAVAIVSTALTVAGITLGAIIGAQAKRDFDCLDDVIACNRDRETPILGDDLISERAKVEEKAVIADMGFLFGGASALVAIVSWIKYSKAMKGNGVSKKEAEVNVDSAEPKPQQPLQVKEPAAAPTKAKPEQDLELDSENEGSEQPTNQKQGLNLIEQSYVPSISAAAHARSHS